MVFGFIVIAQGPLSTGMVSMMEFVVPLITVTESLKAGSIARFKKEGAIREIIIREEIPKFHKIAVANIKKTEPVYRKETWPNPYVLISTAKRWHSK